MISDPLRGPLRRRLVLLGLLAAVLLTISPRAGAAERSTIDFITLSGVIDPVSSRYLLRQIGQAERSGAQAIVVQLDTPGGLDISMREIVQRMLASRVPIVVWVSPKGARAASAGVFISYAAHVLAMSPATNIGAAHPVNLGGGEGDAVMTEKATNDAAAYLRSIADERGRNRDWAERAVRESVSLGASEAVHEKVADFTAGTLSTLLTKLDGREVEVGGRTVTLSTGDYQLRFHKMGLFESILHTAIRPEVAYMLLLLGFYGLLFELYNPGIGLAGVLGGVSLILGFYALSVLPVSWAGVALLVLAVGFMVADLHVAGLGVFTVGGIVALVAGSLLLFAGASDVFRLSPIVIAAAVAGTLLFFISAMTAALRARASRPLSGAEGIVGTYGTARTDIAPDGQVMAKGTLWRARTLGAAIPQGGRVRVRSVAGLMLIVEPAEETERTGG